jgi:hypothetical protein
VLHVHNLHQPAKVRPRQRNDTHVLGSDWNLRSAPPLSERTNDIGETMGRGLLLWLIGIPIPIILLIWLFGGLH